MGHLKFFSPILVLAFVVSVPAPVPALGAVPESPAPCPVLRDGKDTFRSVTESARQNQRIAGAIAPSGSPRVEVPAGLTHTEANDLWHKSEGSDVFPYAWMTHLRSALSSEKGTPFLEDLDKKFGIIRDPNPGRYPVGWIGLGGAWSDETPLPASGGQDSRSELVLGPNQSPKDLEGVRVTSDRHKSIGMVGVNCTLCHTGQITHQGKSWVIEGAPAMVSLRAFFQDMAGSTAATMLQADALEEFLKSFNYPGDAHATAIKFSRDLRVKLGLESESIVKKDITDAISYVWSHADDKSFEAMKKKKVFKAFFEGRQVMTDHLVELLKMTYGFKSTDEVPQTLKLRMKWLATLLGADPSIPTTPEGYDRTDAFGRIANWVARKDHPIALTATTSLPSIWGIKYRDLFHWNANTNSVVQRNIGQSFGLGAIETNPTAPESDPARYDSTTNLHNLHEIEQLVYKIPVPNWSNYFGGVRMDSAMRGCATYQRTCVKCHEAKPDRVGPAGALLDYKVLPLAEIGTDPTHTMNQATPVGDVPFRDALFDFARKVRNRYYEKYGVSPDEQRQWEGRSLRGEEVFRDTVLGQPQFPGGNELEYVNTPPGSGYPARHLSGIWATPPYLHNGSVPNMTEMLKPAAERPKVFFVGSQEYDVENLGFKSGLDTVPNYPDLVKEFESRRSIRIGSREKAQGRIHDKEIKAACARFETRCFDTSLTGNKNVGHEGPLYGTQLAPDEKKDLIEFLKILAPEHEYSWKEKPLYQVIDGQCRAN